MAAQQLSGDNEKVAAGCPPPAPSSNSPPSQGSEFVSSESSQSDSIPLEAPSANEAAVRAQRPVFSLALNKLQPAGAEGTSLDSPSASQSTRRQLSSKLRKFVNFFERSAFTRAQSIDEVDLLAGGGGKESSVITVQTARAALGGGSFSGLGAAPLIPAPLSSRVASPVSGDTPRSQVLPPQRMGSVRDIIKRFDPEAGELSARSLRRESSAASELASLAATPLKRAATLQPHLGTGGTPSVKWQQVEKKVDGKVVGKVWRKFEVQPEAAEPEQPPPAQPSEPPAKENVEPFPVPPAPSPPAVWPAAPPAQPESLLVFDPIGEGDEDNISEGSSSYSSDEDEDDAETTHVRSKLLGSGDSPLLVGSAGNGVGGSQCTAERRKKRRAGTTESGGTPTDDASKTKRASHFVAIRIDNTDVVDAVSRFQGELLHSAPFLDHCKSNVNKLHLTLLVLSLTPGDIPRAKQAMQLGVQRFMKAKAGILEAHCAAGLRDELHGFDSGCGRSYVISPSARPPETPASRDILSEGAKEDPTDVAFKLDFRTIGAFGTRVLFLSPPLRQRLLLQRFHVELARAFGEHGISIVGAGSGWNSAMEIQKQVRARSDEKTQVDHRKSIDSTTASSVSNAANKLLAAVVATASDHLPPGTAILPSQPLQQQNPKPVACQVPPLPQQRVYPESATPLDKMLLRQYDLSSARTQLYIPQITLFKISKAAKRNKSKNSSTPNMPKLKLFPRLYHNLVQRVLQSGLPAPRSVSSPQREPLLVPVSRSSEVPYEQQAADAGMLPPLPAHWSMMEQRSKRPTLFQPQQLMPFSPNNFTPYLPQRSPPSPLSPPFVAPPSPSTIVTSSSPQQSRQPYPYFSAHFAYAPYFASPSQETLMLAAQQAALQQEALRRLQEERFFWPPPVTCFPPPEPFQPPMYKSSSHPGLQSPRRRSASNERRSPSNASSNRQRLKLDKVITTSWSPSPPFGCQSCSFVELLEMSQMDPDGYYKRICRTMLTSNAEVIDNLIFQPAEQDEEEQTETTPSPLLPAGPVSVSEGLPLASEKGQPVFSA